MSNRWAAGLGGPLVARSKLSWELPAVSSYAAYWLCPRHETPFSSDSVCNGGEGSDGWPLSLFLGFVVFHNLCVLLHWSASGNRRCPGCCLWLPSLLPFVKSSSSLKLQHPLPLFQQCTFCRTCIPSLYTHPFQQFVLQERFDHIVGCSEVPRLMDEVDSLETSWEGILGIPKSHKLHFTHRVAGPEIWKKRMARIGDSNILTFSVLIPTFLSEDEGDYLPEACTLICECVKYINHFVSTLGTYSLIPEGACCFSPSDSFSRSFEVSGFD